MLTDTIGWILYIALPLIPILAMIIALRLTVFADPRAYQQKLEKLAAAGDPHAKAILIATPLRRRAMGEKDPEHERLLQTGREARATIVDVRSLGSDVHWSGPPTRLVEVEIIVEGGSGQRVIVRDAVSALYSGRLLKGANVPVRVDPDDESRVAVIWDTV